MYRFEKRIQNKILGWGTSPCGGHPLPTPHPLGATVPCTTLPPSALGPTFKLLPTPLTNTGKSQQKRSIS